MKRPLSLLLALMLAGAAGAQQAPPSLQLTPMTPNQVNERPVSNGSQDVVLGTTSAVQKVDNDAGSAQCATMGASECLRPLQDTYTVVPYPTSTLTVPTLGQLSWSTTYATTAGIVCTGPSGTVFNQAVSLAGSSYTLPGWTGYTPGNYTCTITALNSLGRPAASTATFTIPPAPTVTITAPAVEVVTYSTSNASSASLSCVQGATTLYSAATGAGATNFTLPGSSAWGPGAVTCTETAVNPIGVTASASASFNIAGPSASLVSPSSGTMTWTSANASSATLYCVDSTTGVVDYNGGAGLSGGPWAIPNAIGNAGTYNCIYKAIGAGGATATASATTVVTSAPASPLPSPPVCVSGYSYNGTTCVGAPFVCAYTQTSNYTSVADLYDTVYMKPSPASFTAAPKFHATLQGLTGTFKNNYTCAYYNITNNLQATPSSTGSYVVEVRCAGGMQYDGGFCVPMIAGAPAGGPGNAAVEAAINAHIPTVGHHTLSAMGAWSAATQTQSWSVAYSGLSASQALPAVVTVSAYWSGSAWTISQVMVINTTTQ